MIYLAVQIQLSATTLAGQSCLLDVNNSALSVFSFMEGLGGQG